MRFYPAPLSLLHRCQGSRLTFRSLRAGRCPAVELAASVPLGNDQSRARPHVVLPCRAARVQSVLDETPGKRARWCTHWRVAFSKASRIAQGSNFSRGTRISAVHASPSTSLPTVTTLPSGVVAMLHSLARATCNKGETEGCCAVACAVALDC